MYLTKHKYTGATYESGSALPMVEQYVIPGFKPTSQLTDAEIVAIQTILQGRQPFSLYFSAAIKELSRGLDNRSFCVKDGDGVVMAIDFDELRVISVIGKIDDDILPNLVSNGRRSELHVTEELADKLSRLGAGRLARRNTLRYYQLRKSDLFEVDSRNLRRLSLDQLDIVKRFYAENYDGAIFSNWMLAMPFYGLFVEGELASAGGCVVMDETERAANIGNFLTTPRYRGKGLAKQVTKTLLNNLITSGIASFTLGTTEENVPAWRAYESVGFSLLEKRIELEFLP